MAERVTITGTSYEITAWQLADGTWAVRGEYGEFEIDSVWCGIELPTFGDADAAVLGLVSEN